MWGFYGCRWETTLLFFFRSHAGQFLEFKICYGIRWDKIQRLQLQKNHEPLCCEVFKLLNGYEVSTTVSLYCSQVVSSVTAEHVFEQGNNVDPFSKSGNNESEALLATENTITVNMSYGIALASIIPNAPATINVSTTVNTVGANAIGQSFLHP
nr:hypothetical protein [Tanacetum cinerariifolium]